MKKLMLAFAAAAVAVSAHAVAYDWSASDVCSGFYTGDTEQNAAGTAYLFGADSRAAVIAAIEGGTFVSGGYASSAIAGTSDAFNGGATIAFSADEMAGDNVFGVFLANAVYDYDTGSLIATMDKPYVYYTDNLTVGATEAFGNTHIDFGSQYGTTPTAGNWFAQGGGSAVPEPTSGLLLLLGVAGLALKRKVA